MQTCNSKSWTTTCTFSETVEQGYRFVSVYELVIRTGQRAESLLISLLC